MASKIMKGWIQKRPGPKPDLGHEPTAATATAAKRGKSHPFDWETLQKGTWIETAELERATLRSRSDPYFAIGCQSLIAMIERKTGSLGRANGAPANMRGRRMTDGEALEYTVREAGRASRKLERCADRLADNIDRTQLSEIDAQIHEHARRVVGAMADAQKREKRQAHDLFRLMAKKHGELTDGDAKAEGEF